jgi:hypothetical protein
MKRRAHWENLILGLLVLWLWLHVPVDAQQYDRALVTGPRAGRFAQA